MTTLPAELWLLIFDFLIVPSISPASLCTYINFPEIIVNLRFPRSYPPIEDPYGQLRLVCRAFKSLLGPSPRSFNNNETVSIPNTARAIYIASHKSPSSCLMPVLADPYRSRRIVALHLTGVNYSESRVTFDYLCKHSDMLPSLSSLTLSSFYHHPPQRTTRLWGRLNKAFPLLVCLALRPMWQRLDNAPLLTADEVPLVIFERLEILDMGSFIRCNRLRFPVLRHATMRSSQHDIEILANSPLLESLVIRDRYQTALVDLSMLPQLRLLGIPVDGKNTTLPLPPKYPLHHLCAYMISPLLNSTEILPWLKKIPAHLPEISLITIDLTMLVPTDRFWIQIVLLDAELLGADLLSSGLAVKPASTKTHRIIIERVRAFTQQDPVTSGDSEPGPRFKNFCRSIIRKLHL